MWSQSYSKKVKNLDPEAIWNVWIDVNNWNTWQADIDFAKSEQPLELGSQFLFRPKGGPTINLKITEFNPFKSFTDLTSFPLARMFDTHELIINGTEVEIKTTVMIQGPLAFLWKKIVAENIVKDLPNQTENLIKRVKELNVRQSI